MGWVGRTGSSKVTPSIYCFRLRYKRPKMCFYISISASIMDRLETVEIFVAAAEAGSFIGAARRLGRAPAAMTRAVAALEDRLGIRLFNRTTRAVALTDAGARYLDRARGASTEFSELDLAATGEQQVPRG